MGRFKKKIASARRKTVFRPAWDDTNRDHRREFRLSRSELVRYALHTGIRCVLVCMLEPRAGVYVARMIDVTKLCSSMQQLFVILFELNSILCAFQDHDSWSGTASAMPLKSTCAADVRAHLRPTSILMMLPYLSSAGTLHPSSEELSVCGDAGG